MNEQPHAPPTALEGNAPERKTWVKRVWPSSWTKASRFGKRV